MIEPSVFAVLFGLVWLGVATALGRSTVAAERRSIRVRAEVIDMLKERSRKSNGRRRTRYRPVFRVLEGPYAGQQGESAIRSNPAPHEVGDRVEALLDPQTDHITSVRTSQWTRWTAAAFMLIGGGIIIGALLQW